MESALAEGAAAPVELADPRHELILREAAKTTRTRIRVLDAAGGVALDSHRGGPPEGAEGGSPSMLGEGHGLRLGSSRDVDVRAKGEGDKWPVVPERAEVKEALAGRLATRTRIRAREPMVILFVAEPIRFQGGVAGAVYVTRSTQPVLYELYRIRSGIVRVLVVALVGTALVTLLLSWSISRPLGRLSRAAKRVAAGELSVPIPIGGSGEIRELSEAFAQMKERLEARLRYISEFSADVAHEFKSPLTAIKGAAELLGESASDDPEAQRRFLRNIELDVERLDRLVSRLLVLSRAEASNEPLSPVDLTSVAERVAARSAGVDQRVVVETHGEPPVVSGRESDLETAILNLVDNALRFSSTSEGDPRPVVIELSKKGRGATVRVVDHGPGISPANMARLFDRFFTTDPEGGGTGLGLAIVKAIVEAHGGAVSATSSPGETAFTIDLPGT
jgi:two-component system sensor histidine kinase ChvG